MAKPHAETPKLVCVPAYISSVERQICAPDCSCAANRNIIQIDEDNHCLQNICFYYTLTRLAKTSWLRNGGEQMFGKILKTGAIITAFGAAPLLAANPINGFESHGIGTEVADFDPDFPDFGYFSGGTVEQPSLSIDAKYSLHGENVYYGTEMVYTYTTRLPGPEHCCGYGRMEMDILVPGGVKIEIYSHGYTDGSMFDVVLITTVKFKPSDSPILFG